MLSSEVEASRVDVLPGLSVTTKKELYSGPLADTCILMQGSGDVNVDLVG